MRPLKEDPMEPAAFVLPVVATAALGTALLVPLRDDRDGRRATLAAGTAPLRAVFGATSAAGAPPATPQSSRPRPSAIAALENRVRACAAATRGLCVGVSASFRTLLLDVRVPEKALEPALDPSAAERSFADELGALLAPLGDDESPEYEAALEAASASEPDAVPAQSERCCGEAVEPELPTPAIVLDLAPAASGRVVPLTRLPLRPRAASISWPRLVDADAPSLAGAERRALLERLAQDGESAPLDALAAAYREEDRGGRMLALRALARTAGAASAPIFADALRVGNDEERAFAVDALGALGERESLVAALTDRVEAIAARAALAYVGTWARADYLRELGPHLEPNRIEAVLALLAGIVE
ncbi:MAG: HEAT repeat domain-containing protein [Vulcanimicrobiaceae bacterium]